MKRKHVVNGIAVALLLTMFALALGSARLKSPTMDEQNHIARGTAYLLTGDLRLSVEHPPLVNTLSALPLLLCPQLELPLEHPSWQNGAWYVFADRFLWQTNAHRVECIVFLARLPVMGLGLLLGALLYRWARELAGEMGGLLALFLLVCDPNILAHMRLVTTDLGVTFFVFLALYTLWRVWGRQPPHPAPQGRNVQQKQRHWGNVTLAGIALGLALTAKFSALLLVPLFILVALCQAITHKTLHHLITLLAIFTLAAISLWAVYGFEIGPLRPGGLPLPAPSYLNGVGTILQRAEGGNPAFLLGRYSNTGWWYYFPLAFLVKTPLPTLLLFTASLILTLRRRAWGRDLFLLIPIAAFFSMNLFSHLNIGYRHLLPILPFLFAYIARRISAELMSAGFPERPCKPGKRRTALLVWSALALLSAWYLTGAFLTYPDYLAYFNELAGGSSNGYRWLVDSNLDWGQDLPGLQRYVEEHGLKKIYLSWFGSARPEHYGLPYHPLPGYPLHQGEAETFAFNPYHPAPGTYAISVSNLQGVALRDPDTFLWFRQRRPTARIGNSIFVYEVPAEESEGTVCLGGVHLSELGHATVDALLRRNIHIKTFSVPTSLIWPETGPLWLITTDVAPFAPALQETVMHQGSIIAEHSDYRVIHLADTQALDRRLAALTARSQAWWSQATAFSTDDPLRKAMPLPLPADFDHRVALLGYWSTDGPLPPGETFSVTSAWRVLDESNTSPVIFVHLLNSEGRLVAGWDGLDVAPSGWVEGDTFIQAHRITVPAHTAPGEYLLELGVYSSETLERWPIFVGATDTTDRVLLAPVQVGEEQ